MPRYTETDILLGIAVGIVALGALAGKVSAAPRPTGPSVPPPGPLPSGAPSADEKARAAAMVLEPGKRYEAIVKTPDALAPFLSEGAIASKVLEQTGMVVGVEKKSPTQWLVRGVWVLPPTPIASLPPEIEWIREAP